MKILTVVKTPDFTSIIMYASIDIYIRTADGLLNLGGGQYGRQRNSHPRQHYFRDSMRK